MGERGDEDMKRFRVGVFVRRYHQTNPRILFHLVLTSLTYQKISHNPGIEEKNIIKSFLSSLMSRFYKIVQGLWPTKLLSQSEEKTSQPFKKSTADFAFHSGIAKVFRFFLDCKIRIEKPMHICVSNNHKRPHMLSFATHGQEKRKTTLWKRKKRDARLSRQPRPTH